MILDEKQAAELQMDHPGLAVPSAIQIESTDLPQSGESAR